MDMITALAVTAALGAIVALVGGIVAMTRNGEVAHLTSETWMGWRVVWQALALLFVVLGLASTAAQSAQPAQRECVYDYRMVTDAECLAYRDRMLAAKSDSERIAVRVDLHRVMEARARERGVAVTDWRGLSLAPRTASAQR